MPAISALDAPHPNQILTQRNAGCSRLLKLPFEVRLMIYELAVQVDEPIRPLQVTKGSNKFRLAQTSSDTAHGGYYYKPRIWKQILTVTQLARTCRMIYHELEAKPVFYRINSFAFCLVPDLHCFLAAITPERRGSIRRITIEGEHLDSYHKRLAVDVAFDSTMPLLQQCHDLQQLQLGIEEVAWRVGGPSTDLVDAVRQQLNKFRQWLEGSLFLGIPGLRIAYRCLVRSVTLLRPDVTEDVTIGPNWNGTTLQGTLAEPVRLGLGTEITKIGRFMASKMKKNPSSMNGEAIKFTDEQLKASISKALVHFPGEDRVHQNRQESDIGAISSRTRHQCNAANINASHGTVERTVGRYDLEGLLIGVFHILDIRLVDSVVECKISSHGSSPEESWEPLHAVITDSGIFQLGKLYAQKLSLAAKDKDKDSQVMRTLPAPRDITDVMDGYRKNDPRPLVWATYRRTWNNLQRRYEALSGKGKE